MKALFSLIGYLSTATVIAAALLLGYLWKANVLTNEKMFEVMALLHDVNLEEIAELEGSDDQEAPAEETSLDEFEHMREVKLRNHEVKLNSLKLGRQEFDVSFRRLNEATQRFDQIANELTARLKQQGELSQKQSIKSVVNHLESMKPTMAKDELLMFLKNSDGERDVIMLLKAIQPQRLGKIIKEFKTDEEKQQLQKIHELMLDGFPDKPEINRLIERVRVPDDE